jgi:glucokinase
VKPAALAIDIGGSKIATGLVDSSGELSGQTTERTPETANADEVFAALRRAVSTTIAAAPVHRLDVIGVGVACAGPIDHRTETVSPLNIPAWRRYPLLGRLRRMTGLPVAIEADAIALVIGEHWHGAGQGMENVLAVTLSTGVGGGLILGGRVQRGESGNAGHIGHVVVDAAGPLCACGARGCLEAIASGRSAARHAAECGWEHPRPSGRTLAAAAAAGDGIARRALERAGSSLGTAFASVAALLDLEAIILTGGFAKAGPPLWNSIEDTFAASARLPFASACRILTAGLRSPGLVGAGAGLVGPEMYRSSLTAGPSSQ